MKTSESKLNASNAVQRKINAAPFFQPEESREAFFGPRQTNGTFFKAAPPDANQPKPPSVQTKLTVGAPDDAYEQEADAMADKVAQKLSTGESRPPVQRMCAEYVAEQEDGKVAPKLQMKSMFESNEERTGGPVQRKCAACMAEHIQAMRIQQMGEEEEPEVQAMRIQRMGAEEEEPNVQANGAAPGLQASPDLESRLGSTKSSGSPLPDDTRTAMESSFGADFSGVRVHTNSGAVQMNQELRAQAFTHGSDIYFNSGKYDTQSSGGQRLLAHELTHTVQQKPVQSVKAFSSTQISRQTAPVASQATPICYEPGADEPDPTAKEPERHPTYGQWLQSFRNMQTFFSDDTIEGGSMGAQFSVLGEGPAARGPGAGDDKRPVDFQGARTRDQFIDHPTQTWVNTCLPENLRETAYELPSDCADIAVILRHVWLSAHHRTETYNGWILGSRAGEARQSAIRDLIVNQVYSGSVGNMVNPYADSRGNPIRDFNILSSLLHPGDILVWAHHDAGLGTARTGGHTQTIVDIIRNENGDIAEIQVLQGNQPLSAPQATEIRATLAGSGARSIPGESELRAAPGRRIEVDTLVGSSLRSLEEPIRQGASETQPTWTWDDGTTTIVVAGPPRSAPRPQGARVEGSRQRIRRITDWIPAINSAQTNGNSLIGVWEASLQEMRSLLERDQTVADNQVSIENAQTIGSAAGNRLRALYLRNRNFANLSPSEQAAYRERVAHFIAVAEAIEQAANTNNQQIGQIFNALRLAFESSVSLPPEIAAPSGQDSMITSPPSEVASPPIQKKLKPGTSETQIQCTADEPFTQTRIQYLRDFRALYPNLTVESVETIPDILFLQTLECRSLMNQVSGSEFWQSTYHLSYSEAVRACRLMLQDIILNNYTDHRWNHPGYVQGFVEQALTTAGVNTEERMYGHPAQNTAAALPANYQPHLDTFAQNLQSITDLTGFAGPVRDFAQAIWAQAHGDSDDHGLYFARIQARVLLRENSLIRSNNAGIRLMASLIQTLERVSRGMDSVHFAQGLDSRVLISGFDPFDISQQYPTSNPSGVIAQNLDGRQFTYTRSGSTQLAQIEAVTFPVRYSDFDQGMVESFFEPYMNRDQDRQITAVITVSLDSQAGNYELERHAGGQRGGSEENEEIGTSRFTSELVAESYLLRNLITPVLDAYTAAATAPDWQFITRQIINRLYAIYGYIDFSQPSTPTPTGSSLITDRDQVVSYFEHIYLPWFTGEIVRHQQRMLRSPGQQRGRQQFYTTTMDIDAVASQAPAEINAGNHYGVIADNSYSYLDDQGNTQFLDQNHSDTRVDPAAQRAGSAVEGSGGDYLSNEIYYRTSVIGARYGHAVPNVHIHVPPNGSHQDVLQIIQLILQHGINRETL